MDILGRERMFESIIVNLIVIVSMGGVFAG
jgi:hypothetical protein